MADISDEIGSTRARSRFAAGWGIQVRVVRALMIRELSTRFGRENIGFLWMMGEPLLFAGLVGIMWTILRGANEHGEISTAAFVGSGYIPLTMFRHAVGRAIGIFKANSSLMYHRQVKILDFILVRFLIEVIGGMMAAVLLGFVLYGLGLMPIPQKPAYIIGGWMLYCTFVLSICLILAPLSESSEVFEKLIPVVTYIMIPVSGTFTMNSWLPPKVQAYMIYSPFVDGMEMIRYGIFGELVDPIYDWRIPLYASIPGILIGLAMCRRIRRRLVVE
jgi:capsular polysaccharide transport system permease protein